MTDKPDNRYDMRPNGDGYWTVYDIFTGEPAIVNDTALDMLGIEDADDLVDLLNNQYIDRKKGIPH